MPRRPAHLTPENAASFQAQSVVDRYHLRLPYPPETFDLLAALIADEPRVVLDVGCGPGDLARPLAARAVRVDALDLSAAMLARGRQLPGGAAPNLRWLQGAAEDAPLAPPYALITAGESLHWMDWEAVLPRFARMVTPQGTLAIAHRDAGHAPWHDGLEELIKRYSTIQNYESFDLIALLEERGLFRKLGERATAPVPYMQSVDEYLGGLHSTSSLSLARMSAADAAAFDAGVRALAAPHVDAGGRFALEVTATVVWGRPGGAG